jgi:hypothetical protein
VKELASIIAGFIVAALFTVIVLYLITWPAKDITLKDIPPGVAPNTNQKGPATTGTTLVKSPDTHGGNKVQIDYFIIVGSIRNLTQAQHKAEKLINEFNTNIIVLPPTTEGYYRISCGKYSTLEEAKSTIKSIRTNISSDAWIFSVKKGP